MPFALPADFMARHWRKQPVHLPGAAAAFLANSPTRAEITAMLRDGAPHQTDGATVWFLEGLTSGLPGIEDLVANARSWFEWHDVWCDVFATTGPSSIGSHYDGSDNFTIQLTGNKTWFLSSPEGIHADDRRRRIMCEPGLGAASMPSTPRAFEVRAGDVLYIPSTWIHWGFSDGDSTSVSLVINVATAFHALQEQILDGLRRDPRWSLPLAVGPGSSDERHRALQNLIATDLPNNLHADVFARLGDREGAVYSLKGQFITREDTLTWDQSWIRGYVDQIDPRPEDVRLDSHRIAELVQLRARRNLERLLVQCHERSSRTTNEDARQIYRAVVTRLQGLSHGTLDAVLIDPDVCSWLAVSERDTAMAAERMRAEDPLAHALGLALLPELLAAQSQRTPLIITVGADEDGALALRRVGLQLLLPDHPDRVTLSVRDGDLYRLGPGDRRQLIPLAQPATGPDGLATVALPRSSAGIVITTARSDWLARLAPWSAIGSAVTSTPEWRRRVDAALDVLARDTAHTKDQVSLVSWALLREGAAAGCPDEHPIPEMPGLVLANANAPERLAMAVACAQARAEIDAVAESFSLVAEGTVAPAERKAWVLKIRREYLRARIGQMAVEAQVSLGEPTDRSWDASTLRSAPLTPWGRVILERCD
ncbi:JmjC domain-containing protein [Saccharothrix sp. ST-888]|uniref:JmjC domain-containing protein n=1 Tax=Saccharothrix sp. ST-888 TaxID=1427391 RepID=UPI0005ECBA20|nr:cupin domain-containing protein [Saccharothrix sp. ST-888]KJK58832.1 hypothetical protein UK12_07625 [Saccharothrix sp. ST-888]